MFDDYHTGCVVVITGLGNDCNWTSWSRPMVAVICWQHVACYQACCSI